MSLQDAQDFINRANQDQVIRQLASERFGEIENVGREYGYDFAPDEFDRAMRERKAVQGPGGPEGPDSLPCQCSDAYDGPTSTACTGTACQCGDYDQSGPTGNACQCGETDVEGASGTACTGTACQCGNY